MLTTTQIPLLKKGLSFIPKPKLHVCELHKDITKFMKNRFKFHKTNFKTSKNRNPFRKPKYKQKLNEQIPTNATLDNALWRIRQELLQETSYTQNKNNHLTRKERKALNDLINNPHIIINKADKGNTVVVEDRSEYIKMRYPNLTTPKFTLSKKKTPHQPLSSKLQKN